MKNHLVFGKKLLNNIDTICNQYLIIFFFSSYKTSIKWGKKKKKIIQEYENWTASIDRKKIQLYTVAVKSEASFVVDDGCTWIFAEADIALARRNNLIYLWYSLIWSTRMPRKLYFIFFWIYQTFKTIFFPFLNQL